ncbi:esterase family protein [Pseudoflavitalea sp. G-6-1-2]|uniref:alpha/beta hydrolase n=1 Tax=Pseudoflavitalea sp. G-6-1-2 TaxID=2728841 RepID=UPI00146B4ADC|nr:alpha/beta hydrolase-fold protein [Pseudoflavitalea sp. G-6-1-2]NML22139.1 esterase family protein [Pseudoflavitalea sp. G-6-1-2]
MDTAISNGVTVETIALPSDALERTVKLNIYLPPVTSPQGTVPVLFLNDGQDMEAIGLETILNKLYEANVIRPVIIVAIHCGEDRINEYGMISSPDFKGRGSKAPQYQQFILEDLLPYCCGHYPMMIRGEKAFAGFSLGALSALDIVWNNPRVFSLAGVFSGSLWWRSKDKSDRDYNERRDRLMHRQIREGVYHPGQKFFFEVGAQDEKEDRNRNGVIDTIDDTIDLMRELLHKGYLEGKDMKYLQLPDGKHDVETWGKAMPAFLKWAYPAI